jgi:hypothetical protein
MDDDLCFSFKTKNNRCCIQVQQHKGTFEETGGDHCSFQQKQFMLFLRVWGLFYMDPPKEDNICSSNQTTNDLRNVVMTWSVSTSELDYTVTRCVTSAGIGCAKEEQNWKQDSGILHQAEELSSRAPFQEKYVKSINHTPAIDL